VISDKSAVSGFLLQKGSLSPVAVSGIDFTGKRSKWVVLSAGKWSFMPNKGKTAFTVTVKAPSS
jgi:hypothetical protein